MYVSHQFINSMQIFNLIVRDIIFKYPYPFFCTLINQNYDF